MIVTLFMISTLPRFDRYKAYLIQEPLSELVFLQKFPWMQCPHLSVEVCIPIASVRPPETKHLQGGQRIRHANTTGRGQRATNCRIHVPIWGVVKSCIAEEFLLANWRVPSRKVGGSFAAAGGAGFGTCLAFLLVCAGVHVSIFFQQTTTAVCFALASLGGVKSIAFAWIHCFLFNCYRGAHDVLVWRRWCHSYSGWGHYWNLKETPAMNAII